MCPVQRTASQQGLNPLWGVCGVRPCLPFVFRVSCVFPTAIRSGWRLLEPVNTELKAVGKLDLLPGDCALVVVRFPLASCLPRLSTAKGKFAACDLMDCRLKLGGLSGRAGLFSRIESFAESLARA